MEVSGQFYATAASLAVNAPRNAWNIRFSSPQSPPECSEEEALPSPFQESNPDYLVEQLAVRSLFPTVYIRGRWCHCGPLHIAPCVLLE
jgi:hypothetical protein